MPPLVPNLHARVQADYAAKLTYEEACDLTALIATMMAPIWEAAGLDDTPQEIHDASSKVFKQVWFRRDNWEIWDTSRNDFLPLTMEILHRHFGMDFFDRSYRAHRKYWSALPAPQSTEDRRALAEQRAADRAEAKARVAEILDPLDEALEAMFAEEEARIAAVEAENRAATDWPAPTAQPYGVSPRGAEFWVRDAIRWLGAPEAEVTPQTGDGGLDVVSAKWGAQVKHYVGSVPVEELRATMGAALALGLQPMLWTSGSLTEAGKQFADLALVPVVHYNVETAEITGLTEVAVAVLRDGFRN